jgi:hypothetical protein
MTIRTRKFIGIFLLFGLVIVWSLLGMAVAQMPIFAGNRVLQFVYYAVVGIGWVLPAMPLIRWMARPDPAA